MMSSTSSDDRGRGAPESPSPHAEPVDLGGLTRWLVSLWRAAEGPPLALTGAGVSVASGLRTFRGSDPDAVWNRNEISRATLAHFRADPVDHLRWYFERFEAVDRAQPNPAHLALARLEDAGLTLVTQNIDTLHEQAGSRDPIKVHGSSDRLRCGNVGHCRLAAPTGSIARDRVDVAAFRAAPEATRLPRCPDCGGVLRPHVLFFDEDYLSHGDYRFDEVEARLAAAGIILFVGTSFSVGVTSYATQIGAARGIPMISIDPAGRLPSVPHQVEVLAARSEELLPAVAAELLG